MTTSVMDLTRELVAEYSGLDLARITGETKLADAELDSLDKVQVAIALEETLNIEIDDDALESFHSVADIVDFCEKKAIK